MSSGVLIPITNLASISNLVFTSNTSKIVNPLRPKKSLAYLRLGLYLFLPVQQRT